MATKEMKKKNKDDLDYKRIPKEKIGRPISSNQYGKIKISWNLSHKCPRCNKKTMYCSHEREWDANFDPVIEGNRDEFTFFHVCINRKCDYTKTIKKDFEIGHESCPLCKKEEYENERRDEAIKQIQEKLKLIETAERNQTITSKKTICPHCKKPLSKISISREEFPILTMTLLSTNKKECVYMIPSFEMYFCFSCSTTKTMPEHFYDM